MENKNIKILAIDDNRDNLITLKAIISEVLPQSVVYVELSGQAGIESARKIEPDVILLDIVMPVMDGYQVCKTLKADEQLSETPIIFLTALKGDKQSRILALEAGGEAFLAKPIDAIELKAQIHAMLKIKEAAAHKKDEKLRLESLVQKRTQELKSANIAALNMLEDLNAEIEIRKQRELELIKSDENLKLLNHAIEASSVTVAITDAEGNINYVNPFFTKLTGYSREEVIGKNPRILNSGKQSKEFYKDMWETILLGKDWTGELLNKKKNGELFWEKAVISPMLNSKGVVTNFVTIKDDITERKKILEELVVAKEHAEQSDRLKSAFLANMSHEIRTPMNGILGFAALLKEPGLSGEKQQKYIKVIEKSGDRMLNIINDIVDISKIESGTMKVYITETDVNEKIENLFNFFKPETDAKNIKFSVEKTLPKNDAIIKTDSEKVYAILTNLLKNAIKFTNEGKIEFGVDYESSTTGKKQLKFFIKDTGMGIPKDRQQAIFERFIQADIYDKMALQGAGLGLSIAKAYVELMGGKIWVESEEGIGSVFYFTIPCSKEIEKVFIQDADESTKADEKAGNLKILIAEDDEASSIYLSILVEEFSSEILTAKNGFEAVEIYKHHPDIDLILMDIQMPYLNGYEATSQIRQLNNNVVIIAQTAFALTYDRQKVMEAGCNDYISKPILMNDLKTLIKNYFAQEVN